MKPGLINSILFIIYLIVASYVLSWISGRIIKLIKLTRMKRKIRKQAKLMGIKIIKIEFLK